MIELRRRQPVTDIRRLSNDLHELVAKMYGLLGKKICEGRKDIPNIGPVRIIPRTKKAGSEDFFPIDRVGEREGDCRFPCAGTSVQPINLVLVIVMDPLINLVENSQTCPRRTSRKIDVIVPGSFCTRKSFQDFCITGSMSPNPR